MKRIWILFLSVSASRAQDPLSIQDAIRAALQGNPAVSASGQAILTAKARTKGASSGNLPKLNYSESWTRSDNPVFVFSSLLTQHRFSEANFQVGTLNRPDFLNNFQSLVVLDQSIYDGGTTRSAVKAAAANQDLAVHEDQLALRVAQTYYDAQLAAGGEGAAQAAVRSAEANLTRSQAVRDAGMATEADVLSIRVHLAQMREQEIRRRIEAEIAKASLNDTLGLPLDTPHALTTPLTARAGVAKTLADYEGRAVEARPELRQARAGTQIADAQAQAAIALFRPQIGIKGIFEADRERFADHGAANWAVAATVRFNLFNGRADQARREESQHDVGRSHAMERQAQNAVLLEVRRAWLEKQASAERLQVAAATAEMAEENLRIVKNRYQAGLTTVTELLRSETALLETRLRQLAAIHAQRTAAIALEAASGMLSADSEVLK